MSYNNGQNQQQNQQQQNPQNALVRFIGKVKSVMLTNKTTNEQFQKSTVMLDNPYAQNADNTPNQYYKGHLTWFDAATNTHYLVKQIELSNVDDASRGRGFTNSLKIDLGSEYNVQKLG